MLCSIIGEVSYSSAMNQSSIKTWWMKFGTWANGPRRFCKLLICRRQRRRFQREPIPYICDFSRCRLNVRLTACIQPLLRGHKYRVSALFGSCLLAAHANSGFILRKIWGGLQPVVTFWEIEISVNPIKFHFSELLHLLSSSPNPSNWFSELPTSRTPEDK